MPLTRRDGLSGLAPVKRGRRTHPELQQSIEGLALSKPRRSIAAIARTAQTNGAKRGRPTVLHTTLPSRIHAMDPGMIMLAHQGSVADRDHPERVWRHRAEYPNATWQADHTQLDIVILDTNQQPGPG